MDLSQSDITISHADGAKHENFDPDGVFQIRDLGLIGATKGALEARILSATQPSPKNLGHHSHDVTFQMFYVLRGKAKFFFEGTGEVDVTAGCCVNMPAGIVHDLVEHSEDFEFLEIIAPRTRRSGSSRWSSAPPVATGIWSCPVSVDT